MCIQCAFGFVAPISISNLLILLDVDVYKEHTENVVAEFQRNKQNHTHTHNCRGPGDGSVSKFLPYKCENLNSIFRIHDFFFYKKVGC